MRPWQFSKPKNPGFGIQKEFYLTVLAARAPMPTLQELVNPKGVAGAIEGFGVPLVNQTDPSLLTQPISRGNYAIASKDRKTVLRMLVMARDEAGFDPEFVARSELAPNLSPDALARIRATWMVAQVTFESHDAQVYPALDFLQSFVVRFGLLADGVIADPLCLRYLLPNQVENVPRIDPRADIRDHIAIHLRAQPTGSHVLTRGMQKFGFPELELVGVSADSVGTAQQLIVFVAQEAILGKLPRAGQRVGSFTLAEGGFGSGVWSGQPVLEFRPPSNQSADEALAAWRVIS